MDALQKKLLLLIGVIIVLSGGSVKAAPPSPENLNEQSYQFFKQGLYQKSYQLARRAKTKSIEQKKPLELARALSNQASNLHYFGENERALSLYNESLKLAEANQDSLGIFRALGNTAGILAQLGKTEEELKLRTRQYEVSKTLNDKRKVLSAVIGMSQVHSALLNQTESRKYLKIAQEIWKSQPDPFLGVYMYFAEYDLLKAEGKVTESIEVLNASLEIAEENKFKGLIVSAITNVGEAYFELENVVESENFANKGLALSKQLNHKLKQFQNVKLLTKIAEHKNDFRQALEYQKLANALQESIQGERINMLAEFTKIDREIRETEEELKLSQQRQKIAELKLASQQQLQVIWGAVFLVSVALILFWFYRRSTRLELSRQRRLNQELKQLDQVKDRILTNTSHELRTPINGIVGLSQIVLMENQDKLDDESVQHIQLIEKSGMQLSEIVDDILDLAKLKTHIIAFRAKRFKLSPLINEVILTCRPLLNSDSIELIFEDSDPEAELFHDRTRIKQVLFNLIGNAAKFTKQGKITVSVELNQSQASIEIKDTGIGIPENMLERVFEGFEQVDAGDNREKGGSGLGLAICKEIVTALKGSISLKSSLGKGTQVVVRLPIEYSEH